MNKFTIQEEFAISAGAGSGKTYTLSRRYINAYLGFDLFRSEGEMYFDRHKDNSAEIDEIVTMTFTNAAANEMKERIFSLMKSILKALDNDEKAKQSNNLTFLDELSEDIKEYTKNRLQKGITQINEAYITTIHGFALGMIKKYADYLKINIDNIVDELEQEELFIKSFNITLEEFDLDKLIENIGLYKLKIYAKKFTS
jgi:ATP-dependent exoDNAse (exonuclease V) beta subunit